jgi:cytochrome c oxidase assembly factor CtaG
VLGLLLSAWIYIAGLREMGRRGKSGKLVKPSHIASFGSGLAVIALALLSPIDALSDQLFVVHMVQHILLLVFAPPLLLLGKPVPVLLLGLPQPVVRWVARSHHRSRLFHGVVSFLTAPIVAWVLFNGWMLVWHLPAMYDAALRSVSVHLLEHLIFLVTGMLFWWVLLEPLPGGPRLAYSWRILYAFTAMLPGSALGLLFLFSKTAIYPYYAALPRLWGISVLDDQSMAGLVMWLVGDSILVAAAFWAFVMLMERYERRVHANDAELELQLSATLADLEQAVTG